MKWKRALVMVLATTITSAVGLVLMDRLNVNIYFRGGIVYFMMAMVLRIVARDYIQENMLFGQSWTSWFLGSVGIAVLVNLLMWRFWPYWPR
jgi:hypothetical protein